MKHLLPCSVVAGMVLAPMATAQPAAGAGNGAQDRFRLAQVEQAEVLLQQSDVLLASLHAEGVLSSPCTSLQTPAVRRRGNVFRVLLREQGDSTEVFCQSLSSSRAPFYVSLPLELDGLLPGPYRVLVNDLDLEFRIP